jgi:hypothetical protein
MQRLQEARLKTRRQNSILPGSDLGRNMVYTNGFLVVFFELSRKNPEYYKLSYNCYLPSTFQIQFSLFFKKINKQNTQISELTYIPLWCLNLCKPSEFQTTWLWDELIHSFVVTSDLWICSLFIQSVSGSSGLTQQKKCAVDLTVRFWHKLLDIVESSLVCECCIEYMSWPV